MFLSNIFPRDTIFLGIFKARRSGLNMIPRSYGTHDGSFHADEVTACALLLLFDQIDRNKIVRTRDPVQLSECDYVCDVGGIYAPTLHRFDHHQSQYKGDLSSAGMIWQYLRDEEVIDPHTYDFFNRSLIAGVDAHDNGRLHSDSGSCSFSQVITNFVPPMYDAPHSVQNDAFHLALDFTLGHLQRLLERFRYVESCKEKVAKKMQGNEKILCFEQAMPWMEAFFEMGGINHPALFVVMPSGKHWKLRGIPPSLEEKMKVRVPLPQEWAGLLEADLKAVSKIPGAIFCHKGRFISVWETKGDVYKALDYILNRIVHEHSVQ